MKHEQSNSRFGCQCLPFCIVLQNFPLIAASPTFLLPRLTESRAATQALEAELLCSSTIQPTKQVFDKQDVSYHRPICGWAIVLLHWPNHADVNHHLDFIVAIAVPAILGLAVAQASLYDVPGGTRAIIFDRFQGVSLSYWSH
jgi:hypothetical protein